MGIKKKKKVIRGNENARNRRKDTIMRELNGRKNRRNCDKEGMKDVKQKKMATRDG